MILEVALGILLGYLLIIYWPRIVSGGIIIAMLLIALSLVTAVGIAVFYGFETGFFKRILKFYFVIGPVFIPALFFDQYFKRKIVLFLTALCGVWVFISWLIFSGKDAFTYSGIPMLIVIFTERIWKRWGNKKTDIIDPTGEKK